MNPKVKLGDLVKKARTYRNLSQQAVSDGSGVSLRTVNDIECCRANLRFDTLCSLVQYLQIPVQEIFTQEAEQTDPVVQHILQEELSQYTAE